MFEGWENFYLMVGPAAGGLIGLLFVVVTLTSGRERSQIMRGQALYMTPIVVQFSVVIVASGLAMAPRQTPQTVAAVVALATLAGLANAVRACVGIRKLRRDAEPPHWTDFWWYGVAPAVVYLALGATAPALLMEAASAPEALAAATLALLLVGIRNAWDLVTWIAPMRSAGDH